MDLPAWLNALRGSQTHAELANKAHVSRHQVTRWLSGRATPRLPDFLALLHALTGRAEDFVALWVPIQDVPVLAPTWQLRQQARLLASEEPWSEAILQVVRTSAYQALRRPSAQVLADWLGAPEHDIARTLTRLRDVGLLVQEQGYDVPGQPITVDTGLDAAAVVRLKQHWAQVAANNGGRDDGLCAYNVFACSDEDMQVVRDEMRAAFRRIRARIAASDTTEAAALALFQLVPLSPGGDGQHASD